MTKNTNATGRIGENAAAEFLKRKGFSIIICNYRKPWGEIDIIAEKGGVVRFVEIKSVTREPSAEFSRENSDYRPEELVHEAKIQKIARTAEMYMHSTQDTRDYQVDVVGVYLDVGRRVAKCRLFEQIL